MKIYIKSVTTNCRAEISTVRSGEPLFLKQGEEIVCEVMKIILFTQGERRFFRVCMKWLAETRMYDVLENLELIPTFGRWDDLYVFVGTPVEKDAMNLICKQLALDLTCKTPSLLGKWLKSENASSDETRRLGNITREYLGMTHREYRKTLTHLREQINVLERLMSAGRWDEIEFDKIQVLKRLRPNLARLEGGI